MDDQARIKKDHWEVLWGVQRSQRYHARRQAFFDRWSKATAFVGVVAGSAVVASLLKDVPGLAITASLIVVLMSGIDLVVGTAQMARQHNDLRRRYCLLETDMARDLAPTDQIIAEWRAKRLTIESDEPPTYVALDLLCHNELSRAYEHMADKPPPAALPWYVALTAQFFLWPDSAAHTQPTSV